MDSEGSWSRRDLLKTAATGAVGLGLGAATVSQSGRYVAHTTTDGAAAAASLFSDTDRVIDLGRFGQLVVGDFAGTSRSSLLSRDDVESVQRDRRLTLHAAGAAGDQVLPWGVDRVDADVAREAGETGDGAHVAIIDGGVAADHPDLAANVAAPDDDGAHRAWVECRGDECPHPWSDDGDHGTHVAGTVAAVDGSEGVVGVATDVTIHALKVCDGGGRCRTSHIAEAITHAADQGWDVANLSLGSPQEAPALQAAGEYAVDKGLLLVASAGNQGEPDSVGYPAAHDEFVAVSATSMDDSLASFSSRGPEVDLAAPGEDVCSSVVDGHDVLGGTSMAAPHVAGAAAHLRANGHDVEAARETLRESAEDVGLDDAEQGAGLVDVAAAVGLDSGDDGTGDGAGCPR